MDNFLTDDERKRIDFERQHSLCICGHPMNMHNRYIDGKFVGCQHISINDRRCECEKFQWYTATSVKIEGSLEKMSRHDPSDVALIMDIVGTCNSCIHHTNARLVAYYGGEILIRCNNCHTANNFVPDDTTYTDPNRFKVFLNEEDDEKK